MVIRRNWADKMLVKRERDFLLLIGVRWSDAQEDLLDSKYARTKSEKGSPPLYVLFSEFVTPELLLEGCRRYGAFYGELQELMNNTNTPRNEEFQRLVVRQPDQVSNGEISALRAFLSIIDWLHRSPLQNPNTLTRREEYRKLESTLSALALQTATWTTQLSKEIAVRKRLFLDPETGWSWSNSEQEKVEATRDEASYLAHCSDKALPMAEIFRNLATNLRAVTTTVLNAFPPLLRWNSTEMVQHCGGDLVFGIRPLVYHMIREDLIAKSEIRICRSKSCSRFFRAERRDQSCCDEQCSARVRSQNYYEKKRKPARQAAKTFMKQV